MLSTYRSKTAVGEERERGGEQKEREGKREGETHTV